tara:strand:- start:18882 stop:19319 length:438 start_codon:yes stop_codon:yes gene_type:complete
MNYNINDVLIHKNSKTKWIITSTENEYNDNNLIIDKLYSLYNYDDNKINYNSNMIINELDSLEFFIKEDNYKTYQAQNRLKTLFYYITHYNNDLQPEIYKFNDNYIFYRLSKKDYLRDFLINDIIGCSDLDLIYIAKDLTQNYNK